MTQTNIIILILLIVIIYFWKKKKKREQLLFIENYKFSSSLLKRVQKQHNYLTNDDIELVVDAMRDYFYICSQANGKIVSMPSEIVDVFWHEFILFTREYDKFCKKSFGKFLHHTPTEAMKSKTSAQKGIKRAWRLACAKDKINPKNPIKLPWLFNIDKALDIKGGFKYELNCKNRYSNANNIGVYCATEINCASGCAGDSGSSIYSGDSGSFFDGDGGDSSSSCGGGCGGD